MCTHVRGFGNHMRASPNTGVVRACVYLGIFRARMFPGSVRTL